MFERKKHVFGLLTKPILSTLSQSKGGVLNQNQDFHKLISASHAIFGIVDSIAISICMFLVWLSTCGVDGVDMNCPTVPPTGSGIQVQLPPSLYKASHVSSVNFRLQLMVNSLQPQKQHIAHQHTTKLDVHHKFSISHYKSEPEVSDFIL